MLFEHVWPLKGKEMTSTRDKREWEKQDQTYNIHHGQDVVLDVFASVVADHHFVSHN